MMGQGPATATLAAVAGLVAVLAAGVAGLGYWVFHDAGARRDTSPRVWTLLVVVQLWTLLAYLLFRGPRADAPTGTERLAFATFVAVAAGFAVAAVPTPPDPHSWRSTRSWSSRPRRRRPTCWSTAAGTSD